MLSAENINFGTNLMIFLAGSEMNIHVGGTVECQFLGARDMYIDSWCYGFQDNPICGGYARC